MTLGGVRDFLRTPLEALGFKEWSDPFIVENIPATIFDGAYQLTVGNIRVDVLGGANGKAFRFTYPVTLKVLSKGFRDPASAVDAGLDNAQDIIDSLVDANVDNVGLKQISPTSLRAEPFELSNEHAVMLVMEFDADLVLSF